MSNENKKINIPTNIYVPTLEPRKIFNKIDGKTAEKNSIPKNIYQEFIAELKSADLDRINKFINSNSISVRSSNTYYDNYGNLISDGKTPVHIILELDDTIADNDKKFKIIKSLTDLGAAIDIPDRENIWPIHLASKIQSREIVDLFISLGAQSDRTDYYGNTALHYSILGKSIECPKDKKISNLIPEPKLNDLNINKNIEEATEKIIQFIKSSSSSHMNQIINTIGEIPNIFENEKYFVDSENEISKLLTDKSLSKDKYTDNVGYLNFQKLELENIINDNYDNIRDDIMKDNILTPIDIKLGNTGWGPVDNSGNSKKILDHNASDFIEMARLDMEKAKENIDADEVIEKINMIDSNIFDIILPEKLIETINKNNTINNKLGELYWSYLFYFIKNEANISQMIYNFLISPSVIIVDENTYRLLKNKTINSDIDFAGNFFTITNVDLCDQTTTVNPIEITITDLVSESSLCDIIDDINNDNDVTKILSYDNISFSKLLLNMFTFSFNMADKKIVRNGNEPNINIPLIGPDGTQIGVRTVNPNILEHTTKNIIPLLLDKKVLDGYQNEINSLSNPYNTNNNWLQNLSEVIKNTSLFNQIFMDDDHNLEWDGQNYNIPKSPLPYIITNSGNKFFDPLNNVISLNDVNISLEYHNNIDDYLIGGMRYVDPITNTDKTAGWAETIIFSLNEYSYMDMIYLFWYLENFIKFSFDDALFYSMENRPKILTLPLSEWMKYIDEMDLNDVNSDIKTSDDSTKMFKILYKSIIDMIYDEIRKYCDNIETIILKYVEYYNNTQPNKYYYQFKNFDLLEVIIDDTIYEKNLFGPDIQYLDRTNIMFFNDLFLFYHANDKLLNISQEYNFNPDKKIFYEQFNDLSFLYTKEILKYISDIHTILSQHFSTYLYLLNVLPIIPQFQHDPDYKGLAFIDTLNKYNFDMGNKIIAEPQNREYFILMGLQTIIMVIFKEFFDIFIVEKIPLLFSVTELIKFCITYINKSGYYYVLQVLLPAMIKSAIIIYLIGGYDNQINNNIDTIMNLDIVTSNVYIEEFITYFINKNFTKNNYFDISDELVKFHNSLVKFINIYDAYQIISSKNDICSDKKLKVSNFFDNTYPQFKQFGDKTENNYDMINELLKDYRIEIMKYYETDSDKVNTFIKFDSLSFTNIISNNKSIYPGLQIESDPINPVIPIMYDAISGNLLNLPMDFNVSDKSGNYITKLITNIDITKNIEFGEGFIMHNADTPYERDYGSGVPYSIRDGFHYYIAALKYCIVQTTTQDIYSELLTNNPNANEIYTLIYKTISDSNIKIEDMTVNIIIAKLVDQIVTDIIKFSTRETIINWVNSIITNKKFNNTDIDKIISNIRKKNLTIFKRNNRSDILKNYISQNKYYDYQNLQIEPNVNEINYSSHKPTKDFYDIDYTSDSNINKNKSCKYIDKKLIKNLIMPSTLNLINNDGNTPLHLAVIENNFDLINLLISRGASPTAKNNINNKTAFDLLKNNFVSHLEIMKGDSLNQIFKYIYEPLNDLMLTRLTEQHNNIISDITLAIPIALSYYNHLFCNLLANYRYGFTFDMKKKSFDLISDKLYVTMKAYPYSLFKMENDDDVKKVFIRHGNDRNIQEYNIENINKVKKLQEKLKILEIQLESIEKELIDLTDNKKTKLEELQQLIITDIIDVKNKITDYEKPENDVPNMMSYYNTVYDILSEDENRTGTVIDFYNRGFSLIGNNKDHFSKLWNLYLGKNIMHTPNSLLMIMLDNILQKNVINNESLYIDTIHDIYEIISNFIKNKNPYNRDDELTIMENNLIHYLIIKILVPGFLNITQQEIYKYLNNTYSDIDIEKIIDEFNIKTHEEMTLKNYFYKVFPIIALKYYTGIYDNDYDINRKIDDPQNLYSPIIILLKDLQSIEIDDSSEIIKNFNDKIIPFYDNTCKNFIHHIRLAIYGYERYLLNTYQFIRTYKIMNKN